MSPHWRGIGAYALSEKRGMAALVALARVGVALEALLPWPLKLIIDNVLTGVPMPRMAAWITA